MLAVGREGLETALFLWAATKAAGSTTTPLIGAALGLAVAIVLGYLIYRGALKINLTRFFTWTGAFLIIVAGGVLAYGVHDLQEARFLPGLYNLAFDVSDAIPPGSWYGTLLKGIFNFSPATTKLEAIAWLAYVIPDDDAVPLQDPTALGHLVLPSGARRDGLRRKELTLHASPRAAQPRCGRSGPHAAHPGGLHRQRPDRRATPGPPPTRAR